MLLNAILVKHIFSPWGDTLLLHKRRITFNPSANL